MIDDTISAGQRPGEAGYPPTASDQKINEMGFDLLSELRRAIELAGFDPGSPVLDVATGPGRMAFLLAGAGYRVISGDVSDEVLNEARQRLGALIPGKVELRLLDAARLDLPDDSVRSAIIANAMHHMEEPGKVLAELSRVITADGKLVIIEFNERGFDVINRVHLAVHQKTHDRGKSSAAEIGGFLESRFERVETHELPLNDVWIASGKKSR